MTDKPKISVIIPVKNGALWLDACLQGIMRQSLFSITELVVIDSGSTDGSLDLLRKYPVKIHQIPSEKFNHGLTRNLGVELSTGEYVVMTVQDARPTDELWLQKLMNGFTGDENIAGVCGQQVVPHDCDKNPVDWFRPQNTATITKYQYKSAEEFDALPAAEKMRACSWDDVTAMYRRDALLQIPFRKISYGEDAVWAKEALRRGYTLVYHSGAMVYHYHNVDYDFSFRRSLTVMHLRYRQFGFTYSKPSRSFLDVLRMMKLIVQSKGLTVKERWSWIRYNQQQFKAFKAAHQIFFQALSQDEEKLDEIHEKYCDKPPVPLKKPALT